MRKKKNGFYKNVPQALIQIYNDNNHDFRKLEKLLGVNRYYIYRLLINGIEPTPRTDKGQVTRRKLFLSNKKSKEELEQIKQHRREVKEKLDREIEMYLMMVMEGMNKQ